VEYLDNRFHGSMEVAVARKEEDERTDPTEPNARPCTPQLASEYHDPEKLDDPETAVGSSVADLTQARAFDPASRRLEFLSEAERRILAAWHLRVTRLDRKRDEVSGDLVARIAAYYGSVSEREVGREARAEERSLPPDTSTEPIADAGPRDGASEWSVKIAAHERSTVVSSIGRGSVVRRLFRISARFKSFGGKRSPRSRR